VIAGARALVAGVGNVFFGDDGFGVEVARRLARCDLPAGVAVADYGIRGLHLAFELLVPTPLLVLVDALPRGGAPGSLYVLEPDLDALPPAGANAHTMDLPTVLAAVRAMGGQLGRVLVVGCEPLCREGMGLSEPVKRAVDAAAALVVELVQREVNLNPVRDLHELET
jgi:hydrogenase maturation protease